MSTLAELTNKALSLSVDERVMLAQRVWDSVEHFESAETEKAWMETADRRWHEIESGKIKCLPADEVMRQARKSLSG